MLETLLRGDPLGGVLLEHLADEVLGCIGDSVPVGGVESEWLLQDIAEDLFVIIAFEGRVPAEEDEEDDTETPDIARFVIATLEDLGGDIVGSTDDGVHALNFRLLRKTLRETEIDQFDF